MFINEYNYTHNRGVQRWRILIGVMDQTAMKKHTVDRVRGVKGSKVLRTRKIKINQW